MLPSSHTDVIRTTFVAPVELYSPVPGAGHPPVPVTTRVLHVINGEFYAGAERVQDLLSMRLPQFGVHVSLACVKPDRFPRLRKSTSTALFEIPMRHRFDLRPVLRLARMIRRERYQVIHAHTPRSGLVAAPAAWLAGVPLVYHVHSPMARDTTNWLRNRLNQWVEQFSLARAARVITVSQSLAGHVQRLGVPRDRITVIPNGVPIVKNPPRRPRPVSTWTLGTVALFRPRKGIEVLLETISLLRRRQIDVRLRAIGPFESSAYEKQLKDRVRRLQLDDAVHWTGFTSDVNAELAQIDLFVLPSLFGEGLPMVILEAMACGIPVVATRVEGVPEAVRDGIDGLLADPGDCESLAAVLARVIRGDLDWATLGACARKRQVDSFSDRSMAAGVATVYDGLLGRS